MYMYNVCMYIMCVYIYIYMYAQYIIYYTML